MAESSDTQTPRAPLPAPPNLLQQLLAEAAGTFGLVLVGTGAIAGAEESGWFGNFGISLAFGLVVTAMILAFGKLSGAHINPAVTIGLTAAGRFQRRWVWPYIGAQLLGALAASLIVHALFPTSVHLGATLPKAGWLASFGLELAMTLILMLVILSVSAHPLAARPRIGLPIVALAVGATVMLLAYLGGPLTGASMNPARSFGPALISGGLAPLPLYGAATVLGALLAIPVCRLRGSQTCCPDPTQ